MNIEQVQLEMQKLQADVAKYKTSHVLHFLLSVFSGGLWLIAWVLIAQHNGSYLAKHEKMMKLAIESRAN